MLIDPLTENLFLMFGSQPIGNSTPDEWVAATIAADDCPATTEPIAVDGATGLIEACHPYVVAVTTAGRGYFIRLYTPTSNEGFAFAPYDRAWLEEVLATVQLHPEDAIDVAPSPASAPPLTQSFTSPLHGISLSYPEGWTAQAATEPWTDGPSSHSIDNSYDDRLYHPTLTDHLFLVISSQPIGDSTPEDWITEQMAEWADWRNARQPSRSSWTRRPD